MTSHNSIDARNHHVNTRINNMNKGPINSRTGLSSRTTLHGNIVQLRSYRKRPRASCPHDEPHCESPPFTWKTTLAKRWRTPDNQSPDTPRSLYRRSLKLALDWAVQRQIWRGQALYIRSLFEANRNITDSRQQRVGPAAQQIFA